MLVMLRFSSTTSLTPVSSLLTRESFNNLLSTELESRLWMVSLLKEVKVGVVELGGKNIVLARVWG